jgi:hypothetical protein
MIRSAVFALAAAASLTAQDYAIRFDGGSISCPHNAAMLSGPNCTIEAWVKAEAGATGYVTLFERYADSAEHKALAVKADGSIYYMYAGSPWSHNLGTGPGLFPMDGLFHHIAFTRRADQTYSLHVDGISVLAAGPGPCWLTCNVIETTTQSRMISDPATSRGWLVDGLRVSRVARYSSNFSPQRVMSSDAQTVLLFNFREGQGATTQDESPVQQTGSLSAAGLTWVSIGSPGSFVVGQLGCAGSNGQIPSLLPALGSLPTVGRTFSMTVTGASNNPLDAAAFGLVGFTTNGPRNLASLGMPGCVFQFIPDPEVVTGLIRGGGAVLPLAIPNYPGLLNVQFYVQGVCQDRLANPTGLTLTNAATCLIGS